MAKRHKLRARERRKELQHELGDCCCRCGSVRKLEFDCIIPQGDEHHKMDTSQRMCFYYRQHAFNNVQLLCRKCHKLKTRRDNHHARYKALALTWQAMQQLDPF